MQRIGMAAAAALILGSVAACGGGGGGSGSSPPPPIDTWMPGVFQPESHFAAQCAAPRSGTDPFTGHAYPDVQGTATDENNWLRSWSNELYLWYSEVPDLDPSKYATADYFPLLKTSATDAQGQAKDKFHFTYTTSAWEALSINDANIGYGVQFFVLQATPPRQVIVAYTQPGSPAVAAPASLVRGATVLTVDGVDVVNGGTQADVDAINAGLSPATVGESHTFGVQDPGSSTTRTFTIAAANITDVPVQDVSVISGTHIGYMLFNDQLATAEGALIDAVNTLKADNVTDLVLDIRYNGGGYLDIASELAYMIAGPVPTAGQTFDQQQFNSKHPTTNPVTGAAAHADALPHHHAGILRTPAGAGAADAESDARVRAHRTRAPARRARRSSTACDGVGVQVIQIGTTTCGKPYGFYPQDNCGTTYFTIEFQGVNAQGFGDYPDGFTPGGSGAASFPGCTVSDDFTHQLGDPNESLLFVAQAYAAGATCPVPPAGLAPPARARGQGFALRSPLREMRLMRRQAGLPR